MRKVVRRTQSVAHAKTEKLLEVLRKAGGGPLKVKEVAELMGVSPNTAGKYVDICER